MYLAFQIPFADRRHFLKDDRTRSVRPFWTGTERAGSEFMRSMGLMKPRNLGGVEGLPNEDVYFDPGNWLRYEEKGSRYLALSPKSPLIGSAFPAFRRWIGDGHFVFRLELGWRARLHPVENGGHIPEDIVRAFMLLRMTTCVQNQRKVAGKTRNKELKKTSVSLGDLHRQALKAYVRSTSVRGSGEDRQTLSAIRRLTGLLYIEFREDEPVVLPDDNPRWTRVPLDNFQKAAYDAWAGSVVLPDFSTVRTVCVRRKGPQGDAKENLRDLRLHLFRMNSDVGGLSDIADWPNDAAMRSLVSDGAEPLLIDHLEQTIDLFHGDRGQNLERPGHRAARTMLDLATSGLIKKTVERLRVRYAGQSETLMRFFNMNPPPRNVQNFGPITAYGPATFGPGSPIYVNPQFDVASAKTIEEALTRLEALVKTVTQNVADPVQKLALEKGMADLKKEDVPRDRHWYDVSAKGLREAAEAVGDIAKPVAVAAGTLIAMLPTLLPK